MNPAYRRNVPPAQAQEMRWWEVAILAAWSAGLGLIFAGALPSRVLIVWYGVLILVSVVPLYFYGTKVVDINREQLKFNEQML